MQSMVYALLLLAQIGLVLLVIAIRLLLLRRERRIRATRRRQKKGYQHAWEWVMGRRTHRQLSYRPEPDPAPDPE
jgi:hypothetical protein